MAVNQKDHSAEHNTALRHHLSNIDAWPSQSGQLKYAFIDVTDLEPILFDIAGVLYLPKGSEENTVQALKDLADKFREMSNRYTINSVGVYQHAYEYFYEEYSAQKMKMLNANWDGSQSSSVGAVFEDDLNTYGDINRNHRTLPDEFKGHPSGIHEGKAIYSHWMEFRNFVEAMVLDDIFAILVYPQIEDDQSLWPKALNYALKRAGLKSSKSGGRRTAATNRASKADKLRKQKKKLLDQRNLTQQAILMLDLEDISKRSQFDYNKAGYKNFLCLHDNEPSTTMSKLMSVNFLPISKLKSEHLSALIPEMRFFKVETEIDYNGQVIAETGEKEFFFPTHADEDQYARYNSGILDSWKSIISDVKPNVGVRSVEWANRSGNYILEKSGLKFSVQFYGERLADLFTNVEGYDQKEEFRYSDLFTTPVPYFSDKSNPNQVMKVANENYYRLRAKFGWRLSKTMQDNILANTSEEEKADIIKGWNSLTEQKMVVDLTLVNFDLQFEENGTAVVNVQYNSFIQQYMGNMDYSNILLSSTELERLSSKRKKQNKLENLKKQKKTNKGKAEKAKLVKAIEADEEAITALNSNLSARYSSLVAGLIKKNAIRIHTAKKKDVMARFQKRGVVSQSAKLIKRYSLNIQVEYPQYTEESFIDLTKAKKSLLFTDFDFTNQDGPILKHIKHRTTGEMRYAYYPTGSPRVQKLPGFDDKLITEAQAKSLFTGVSLTTVERVTVASEKSKEDPDAAQNQAAVKDPVVDTKLNKDGTIDIKKMYKALDKAAFNAETETYNIKYFFLGDLLDVALGVFVKNTQSAIDLRVILGTVQLKNYSDNVVEGVMDFDINNDTGLITITGNKDMSEEDRKQKAKMGAALLSSARLYYRNLADIPICFNSFLVWFYDNVVSKNLATLPLDRFVRDVLGLVTTSHNSFGDYAYMVPKQEMNIARSFSSAPKQPDEDFDYFGMKFAGEKLEFIPSLKSNSSTGRVDMNDLRYQTFERLSDDSTTGTTTKSSHAGSPISFFEKNFKNASGIQGTNKYMFLLDIPRSLPPFKLADFVEDSQSGIPHFFLGAASGIVKNIKFNLVPNPLIQADQMLRKPNQSSPKFPIKGRYECDITLVGNNFFTPGMVIYLNPASLRLGNPTDFTSPINHLGIMGYYTIHKMSSYIEGGTYETKISCRYVSPGNGLDEHGRLARKSPMGNS